MRNVKISLIVGFTDDELASAQLEFDRLADAVEAAGGGLAKAIGVALRKVMRQERGATFYSSGDASTPSTN